MGTLLLFETVIPPGNVSSFSKLFDLNMLVMTGGRERTEEEYQVLLLHAGFQLTQVIPTSSPISVIEAVKI
ncbi:methyltransferase [Nostoc flagelliforme]|uniref:methyltransferase n=1 Tax=Nostoc flagelliforme TaxID=1306274 RepID=UPI001F558992|nr:methyltransferase [Nostoc flagelliforme]